MSLETSASEACVDENRFPIAPATLGRLLYLSLPLVALFTGLDYLIDLSIKFGFLRSSASGIGLKLLLLVFLIQGSVLAGVTGMNPFSRSWSGRASIRGYWPAVAVALIMVGAGIALILLTDIRIPLKLVPFVHFTNAAVISISAPWLVRSIVPNAQLKSGRLWSRMWRAVFIGIIPIIIALGLAFASAQFFHSGWIDELMMVVVTASGYLVTVIIVWASTRDAVPRRDSA